MTNVKDSFEIKQKYGLNHAAGVVVVFEVKRSASIPTVGAEVMLRRPGGGELAARVGEIKEHGSSDPSVEAKSFFFEGLTQQDVPIGTEIHWPECS